jgi:hypothetical protein
LPPVASRSLDQLSSAQSAQAITVHWSCLGSTLVEAVWGLRWLKLFGVYAGWDCLGSTLVEAVWGLCSGIKFCLGAGEGLN